jgi:hypothetical protein
LIRSSTIAIEAQQQTSREEHAAADHDVNGRSLQLIWEGDEQHQHRL